MEEPIKDLHAWLMTLGIYVIVEIDTTLEPKFVYSIYTYINNEWKISNYSDLYKTYNEALTDGVEYALKNELTILY